MTPGQHSAKSGRELKGLKSEHTRNEMAGERGGRYPSCREGNESVQQKNSGEKNPDTPLLKRNFTKILRD